MTDLRNRPNVLRGYVDLNLAASSGASLSGNNHSNATNSTPIWVWVAMGFAVIVTLFLFVKGLRQKGN